MKAKVWITSILVGSVIFGAILMSVADGAIRYRIKYGTEAIVNFELYDSNSPWRLYETVPSILDCNLYIDQATTVPPDNVPVDEGPFMSWTITAAEATSKIMTMTVADLSAPPVYMAQTIIVTTYGHASAFEPILTTAETVSDGASQSTLGDKIVADMDANSLLVNWTSARAAILTDLAGISEIGDKIVADMDANSTLDDILTDTASIQPIVADLAGISQIGDKVQADMDANSLLVNYTAARAGYLDNINNALLLELGLSEIGDKVVADMDANSALASASDANGIFGNANWTAAVVTLDGIDANATLILADTSAQDTEGEWTTLGAGIISGVWSDANGVRVYEDANTAALSSGTTAAAAATAVWADANGVRVYEDANTAALGASTSAIADAVLDEVVGDHITQGTLGWYIRRIYQFLF